MNRKIPLVFEFGGFTTRAGKLLHFIQPLINAIKVMEGRTLQK